MSGGSPEEALARLRAAIDAVDRRLLALLNERATLAREVGAVKAAAGRPFYVPGREEDLVARLLAENPGPFPSSGVRAVWREVVSASLALEQPLAVAYLGPPATFTHQACLKQFGLSAQLRAARTIADVFDLVEKGKAEHGVIPVENTTEGVVSHTLDLFLTSELKIVAEVLLPVSHSLLNQTGRRDDVARIASHPHAVAQCRRWLQVNFPEVPVVDANSTAEAAKLAAEDPGVAAVASELAGSLYGLQAVESRIEDNTVNFTRFLVVGRSLREPTGRDKTSLAFAVRDEVGVLHRMLQPFADNGVNLTKIESRPLKTKAWEYVFFVDLEGHVSDPAVARARVGLEPYCQFLRVLGSYPKAASSE